VPPETIAFDEFELDPRSFELRRQGQLVKVERIPLQLLFLLAENRDRLISREEILEAIRGKNQFLDADNSINAAIRKARQALKDVSALAVAAPPPGRRALAGWIYRPSLHLIDQLTRRSIRSWSRRVVM
jgi:DNA-binding winged helix-turn-helix (wHTH) protein